jgi:hypothetical protein
MWARLLFPNSTIQHAGVLLGIQGKAGHAFWGIPAEHPGESTQLHVLVRRERTFIPSARIEKQPIDQHPAAAGEQERLLLSRHLVGRHVVMELKPLALKAHGAVDENELLRLSLDDMFEKTHVIARANRPDVRIAVDALAEKFDVPDMPLQEPFELVEIEFVHVKRVLVLGNICVRALVGR